MVVMIANVHPAAYAYAGKCGTCAAENEQEGDEGEQGLERARVLWYVTATTVCPDSVDWTTHSSRSSFPASLELFMVVQSGQNAAGETYGTLGMKTSSTWRPVRASALSGAPSMP